MAHSRLSLIVCLGLLAWAAKGSAQILPADRTTVWKPGVPGGIPPRTTVCARLEASTYGNGVLEASAAIQSALDACPPDQVVMLSAGTFTVNHRLLIHSPITLRGAGAGRTILRKTNGARPRLAPTHPIDPSSYTHDPQPVVVIGPQRWVRSDDTTSQNLTTDGAKGATTVTIANASGFEVGAFVLLDERSGASWQPTPAGFPDNALVWQGDRVAWNMHLPQQRWQDDSQFADVAGPFDLNAGTRTMPNSMSWFARPDRPINEIKEIAAVSGTTVTFTTPLHISYRTSHAAQLTRYTGSNAHLRNAGIESLTTRGGADGQIRFENAAYSWARNVEVTQWIGEGVAVNGSFRVEVRDSYVHDGSWPAPGGAGYALSFARASSEILVENNIFINACKLMVARSSGAGSVIAYNYADDAWDFDAPGWVEVGLNASHMAGPHHILFEGNYSHNVDSDFTHGNAIDLTFFRNWLSGQRRSFTDASNARTVGLAYGSWWDSFVGNVLGRPGQMSGWVYEAAPMTGTNATWSENAIWKLGYDPQRWTMYADPRTLSTVIRDGNWDFVTNSVRWHNTPAGFVIPDSLYLSAKPDFFGTHPWPWVNPANGETYTLPAKARYDAGTPNDTGGSASASEPPKRISLSSDFNNDGKADRAVFRPSSGNWHIQTQDSSGNWNRLDVAWGLPGDVPLSGDFDGDGQTELAVFRPANGTWYLRHSADQYATSTSYQWGLPGDVPLVTDFDGDARSDLVVYRPSSGLWFIRYSSLSYRSDIGMLYQWGLPGDIPLAADFDGDERTDLVVYRPSSGTWFVRTSSTQYSYDAAPSYQWGQRNDLPLSTDFDGDGKTDVVVYREATGQWFIRYSSHQYGASGVHQWGVPGDIPVPDDFDGDGRTELAVWRPSTGEWFVRYSSSNYSYADFSVTQWGLSGDIVKD
jgi:hypothetical protein